MVMWQHSSSTLHSAGSASSRSRYAARLASWRTPKRRLSLLQTCRRTCESPASRGPVAAEPTAGKLYSPYRSPGSRLISVSLVVGRCRCRLRHRHHIGSRERLLQSFLQRLVQILPSLLGAPFRPLRLGPGHIFHLLRGWSFPPPPHVPRLEDDAVIFCLLDFGMRAQTLACLLKPGAAGQHYCGIVVHAQGSGHEIGQGFFEFSVKDGDVDPLDHIGSPLVVVRSRRTLGCVKPAVSLRLECGDEPVSGAGLVIRKIKAARESGLDYCLRDYRSLLLFPRLLSSTRLGVRCPIICRIMYPAGRP